MPVQIDSEFPGGNIVVEDIRGNEVRLHQDLRDTAGDWFYWCFRLRGAAGRTLRFEFTRSRAIGVRGPAISLDHGKTWRWLGLDDVQGNSFSCAFPSEASEVRLSYGMPYQESNWRRFIDTIAGNRHLSVRTLCTTPKQRDVEYALLGCLGAEPAHRVAITCRHHCCEMMASYALEGLIQWVAEDSDPDAQWLQRRVQFFIVPFVDKDGVEAGDQGKNRQPHDHGRDYAGESLFASTAAIRDLLPRWSAGRLRVGLDLHCPWIAGPQNEVIFLVGVEQDGIVRAQQGFSQILESVRKGPLPFHHHDFLPMGKAWNKKENYAGGKTFENWLAEWQQAVPGMGIEIPYANACGEEVNQTSARLFGNDLGRGLAAYLRGMD